MLRLAKLSIRFPVHAIVVWAFVAFALTAVGLGVSRSLSPSVTVVPGSESSRAQQLARDEFGPSVLVPILLEGPKAQLDRQGPRLVAALAARRDTRVMSAWSQGETGASLRPSTNAAMIVASVARTERAMVKTVQPQIERLVAQQTAAPVQAHITGQPTLDRALKDEALATTRRAELIAIGVLFALLLIGLRAPVAALLLSAFGALTTLSGIGVMTLLAKLIDTDPIAVALGSIAGLALGVGFGLVMLDRFREEQRLGRREAALAASSAVGSAGRAVLVSGTAMIVALVLAVAIAPTTILMSLGIGVLLCSTLATGAAVVVLPAALTVLGRRVFAFSFPAPGFLARGWDWLVGRGRWVTRGAVVAGAVATAALVALAVPAAGLETGPPDVSMLPASAQARQDFERVATVMGPGWPTPYNVVVVSKTRAITDPALLRDVRNYQKAIAEDVRVDSVVGPGAFVAQARDLQALPAGLKDSAKLLKGGKRDLGRLENGLGQAGAGARKLRAGLGSAAQGAGQLTAGSGAAGSGAGQLRAGLEQARAGAAAVSGGLRAALTGATALKRGSGDALAGAKTLTNGVASASAPVKAGLPVFNGLARDVGSASAAVTSAHGTAQSASGQVASALGALKNMTTGRDDPAYAAALNALSSAQASASSVESALGGVQGKLSGAAGVSAAAAQQVAQLSKGLQQLHTGSSQLSAGIARLSRGNADLASGLSQLSGGGGKLTAGLQQLRDGAAALETGLGQLTSGAGQLQTGLGAGVAPAGQLAGGLNTLEAGVAKFRGQLPSTKDIERLQRESPGLFDSGYFVLAAIQGASPADRALASFAVNVERGGTAGQIVVVPREASSSDATRALASDLRDSAAAFAAKTGTQTAVGGPAGDLADFTSETSARLPFVVGALALAIALVLMAALRTVVLPLVASAFNLLTAAATFGAMALLFGGDDPLLGGPGYLDPMSVIGIFAAIFGIAVTYDVLLLMRTRERLAAGEHVRDAVEHGLRQTAAVATGAAIVMIAVGVPFAFSELANVRQFGVGIAIAVTLSALVVRPVLLPAAAALLGRRGWWPTALTRHGEPA
jgi:RND superfamily putative drug exporter